MKNNENVIPTVNLSAPSGSVEVGYYRPTEPKQALKVDPPGPPIRPNEPPSVDGFVLGGRDFPLQGDNP